MKIRTLIAIGVLSTGIVGSTPARAGKKGNKQRSSGSSKETEKKTSFSSESHLGAFHFDDKFDHRAEKRAREALRIKSLPFKTKLDDKKRAAIDKMLSGADRPSLEDFKKVMKATYGDKLPDENPFGDAAYVRFNDQLIAHMIAQVEYAYPGGNYYALGRDAVLVADTMHAFYSSIGQASRVKRLDMSGNSLPHYRGAKEKNFGEDREIIYDYLVSNGLDLKNAEKKPPYVMIDITGYSPDSQSTQLMRSAFRTAAMQGLDLKKLSKRVAFIGIGGTSSRYTISEVSDVDATKAEIASNVSNDGPERILYLGGKMKDLSYKSEGFWHDDFLKYEKDSKGVVISKPGEPESEARRVGAMAELYEVMRITESPKLLKLVQGIAKDQYGYEFPLERTEQLKRTGKRVVAAQVEERKGSSSDGVTGIFLANLKDSLKRDPSIDTVRVFLSDLAGMWSRKSVPPQFIDDAISAMVERVPELRSGDGYEMRKKIYAQHPGFGDVFYRVMTRGPIVTKPIEKPAPVAQSELVQLSAAVASTKSLADAEALLRHVAKLFDSDKLTRSEATAIIRRTIGLANLRSNEATNVRVRLKTLPGGTFPKLFHDVVYNGD